MSSVHTIRLRDPWQEQSLDDGRVEYRRRFGRPRLGEAESVWLVCTGLSEDSTAELNGEPLPTHEIEVTFRLQPRNEIVIVTNVPFGEVSLEIRAPA